MSRTQSWEVSDKLWSVVEPLIPKRKRDPNKIYKRKPGAGRKVLNNRTVFEAIVYVLRTGCQWKALPKDVYGSSSAIHRYFMQWSEAGVFLALWKTCLAEYDELKGIQWEWQSIDGAMHKAPLAQESAGPNPTDRGKMGTKRHLLTDGRGAPIALVVTGANRHDVSQLELVLDTVVVERPETTQSCVQHLCADKAFDSPYAVGVMKDRGYVPHVVSRGQERQDKLHTPGYKARRWVVEACHSWLNRFRKILVRYEKTDLSYKGLVYLACAIISSRKAWAI